MLKTNSKKARENIRKYIETSREYYEELFQYEIQELEENPDYKTSTYGIKYVDFKGFEALATYIYQVAKKEKEWSNHEMCQNLFTEWLQGLTSGGLGDFYVRPCKPLLASILEETEEEAENYTEEDAETLLSYLIYREIYNGYIHYITH